MKKILSITLVNALFALAACGQKLDMSKVPAAVKSSFTRQFPGAVAKWEKEEELYEAGFQQDGHEMSALFEANGTLKETEIGIPPSELPAHIKQYVKDHYKGMSIKEAAKITSSAGDTEYEAAIKGRDLIFDNKGNFIKEIKH
ncbi:MAG: PepSY-like domain-containing protein [Chitinophagaceae bacterium]